MVYCIHLNVEREAHKGMAPSVNNINLEAKENSLVLSLKIFGCVAGFGVKVLMKIY